MGGYMNIDGKLAEAIEKAVLTRLERSSLEKGHFTGYVIDATDELVLLLVVGDLIRFNGFSVLRVGDLSSIEVPAPNRDFIEQALHVRGEEVVSAPRVDLASLVSALSSAGREFPLITIHQEEVDPDVCFIGRVTAVDEAKLTLLDIDSNAEWDEEPTERNVTDITRVDFGGQYEDALFQVGGEPPD